MTDDELTLAKRLGAHEFFWRNGMAVGHVDDPESVTGWLSPTTWALIEDEGTIPNLSDAATKGVLLEMVREAAACPMAWTFPRSTTEWEVQAFSDPEERILGEALTEGAALATALLAAWGEG